MEKTEANYEVLNVGTDKPTAILDLANIVIGSYGRRLASAIVSKYRIGNIRHCCYGDISRTSRLGFEPKVKSEEGMKELVAWGNATESEDRMEETEKELQKRGLVKA